MTTIMPQSELVRKAAIYIEEERQQGRSLAALLDDAAMRFNLSPREDEMLRDFFRSTSKAGSEDNSILSGSD